MKALILAAGFGTRLLPVTKSWPKPLFPIGDVPLIDRIIKGLKTAGCESIMINTHHLNQLIEKHISENNYGISVSTCHEPEILGTGGAIKNVSEFWDTRPFFVVNSDIVTDLEFNKVYKFHLSHRGAATLVLKNDPECNFVTVSPEGTIIGFNQQNPKPGLLRLAFTGIQVLDPSIIEKIPYGQVVSSIEVYRKIIDEGQSIYAFIADTVYWKDIGTHKRYQEAVLDSLVPEAFQKGFPKDPANSFSIIPISGDGSDRKWLRAYHGFSSLVIADYGILGNSGAGGEFKSFTIIGKHLRRQGIPVPKIYLHNLFAGLVFLEDLGDISLQCYVNHLKTAEEKIRTYQLILDNLLAFFRKGTIGFDLNWTCQSTHYDQRLIIETECRYFLDSFVNGFFNYPYTFEALEDEFSLLADKTVFHGYYGLMHRDFQSRNIMVYKNRFYIIDFQGARWGPVQYDLASLLIDPYVPLSVDEQAELLEYFTHVAVEMDSGKIKSGFTYCAIARNLQILGAFAFLSTVKGKHQFEAYIPRALESLKSRLCQPVGEQFPKLKALVHDLMAHPLNHSLIKRHGLIVM
jgi:aminoglycoside/choline kinase family phosphotransferase/dTDP-glucose pyrophosphorylase